MHLHGKKVIYTPGKFGSLGGRGRANSWKKSIKHQGKSLAAYIQLHGLQGNVEESVTPTPPIKLPESGGMISSPGIEQMLSVYHCKKKNDQFVGCTLCNCRKVSTSEHTSDGFI